MKTRKSGKIFTSIVLIVALTVLLTVPVLAAGKHTVTFIYGTKVQQVQVDDGGMAILPTDTEIPGYVFLGWVGNAMNVTEDRTLLGAYSKVDTPAQPTSAATTQDTGVTYKVKFVDGLTGANYYNQTVSAGADANPPEIPHHEGWHFDHYEGNYQCVNSDRTITVIYEEDWYWVDHPWWYYYSTDDPDFYQPYWWM